MKDIKALNRTQCGLVRREFSRHKVDCGEVQVTVLHGVVYLHGRVRPLRGREATFGQDLATLLTALRNRAGIKDVIAEWTAVGA